MSFFISNSRNYLFVFLATLGTLLTLVAVSTELLIRMQVEPNDTLFIHLELFRTSRSTDIALGDSHTANAFTATNGFVNLAFPNENISAYSRKVAVYLKGKPPGRIILQADPHMFAAYQSTMDVGYLSYLESPEAQAREIRLLNSYHRPKLFAYWLAFLQQGRLKGKSAIQASGWLPNSDQWNSVNRDKRLSLARERAEKQRPVDGFEGTESAREYRDILRFLASQDWKACLVEYPASDEWLKETQGDNFEKARAWYRSVAEENGATYLEYRAIFTNQPELFSDMDHLNTLGAAAFTKTVLHDCFGLQ